MTKKEYASKTSASRFLLNAQILADDFAAEFSDISLFCRQDPQRLEGMRFYQPGCPMTSNYIYLLPATLVTPEFTSFHQLTFLVCGRIDPTLFSETCVVLQVGTEEEFGKLANAACRIFEKYQHWDHQLQLAINSDNPLEEMLEASLEIFQNPIFVHDQNFYILSSPRHAEGMSIWETDTRTGRLMVPLSLIHEFRTDMEYLRTLNTHGADMYSEELRGYPILYMNLWMDDSYEGRICVDELQTPIRPGQFAAMQYLGTFIELCIRQHNLFHTYMGNDSRQFFVDYLDGKVTDPQLLLDFLRFSNWNPNDRYLCLRLETEQPNARMHSSVATLGHIEAQIPEGRAFLYQQGIVVVANLSYEHSSVSDILSSLAIILREGLFKMGTSSELDRFTSIPQGYLQAKSALKMGKESGSMIWCYRFDDYRLKYILYTSASELSPELLASGKLTALQTYDEQNGTNLYETLRTYLNLERNALQTSKALFIHRSTLFYRLEKIQKLTKTNLEDPDERLTLLFSYHLLELRGKDLPV